MDEKDKMEVFNLEVWKAYKSIKFDNLNKKVSPGPRFKPESLTLHADEVPLAPPR